MKPKGWLSRAASVGRMRSKTPKRNADAHFDERDYARCEESAYEKKYISNMDDERMRQESIRRTGSAMTSNGSVHTSAYSQYGGVAATSSMVSGAQNSFRGEKKLVVHYTLQHTDDPDGGSGGTENEAKIKARVETAPMSLEECLDIQGDEERRMGQMDRAGRKMYEKYQKQDIFHYITPASANIDASDAIGIVSSYILAYRILHSTSNRPLHKYDKVLVTKAQGALGRAVIELAISAGASNVFGVSPAKYHQRIARWGATPLEEEEYLQWSEYLMGSVDIVIDIDGSNASSAAAMVANQATGKLVRIFSGPNHEGGRRPKSGNNLVRQPKYSCDYDVFSDMESDIDGFRSDLQLLFDMVYQGYVKPKKKKAIPLDGISYIEVRFEKSPDWVESNAAPSASAQEQDVGGRNFSGDADEKSSRSQKSNRSGSRSGSKASGRSSSSRHRSDSRSDRYEESHADDRDEREERSASRSHKSERDRGGSRSLSRPKIFERRRSKHDNSDQMREPPPSRHWQDGEIATKSSMPTRHSDRSVHSTHSRSSRSRDGGRSRSSARRRSFSYKNNDSSNKKRSKSLPRFRRGSENDSSHGNGPSSEDRPWDSGYDHVKSEHEDQYSRHYLMRDMSTQSFLLALGKNPNG